MIGNKVATIGILTFVSGNKLQTRYERTTIGKNKVLFKIE